MFLFIIVFISKKENMFSLPMQFNFLISGDYHNTSEYPI